MKKLFCILVGLILFNNLTYAIAERTVLNYSSVYKTPITTINATTLDKGTWSINQRTEYYQVRPLSDATLLSSQNFESEKIFLYNYLILSRGITKDLTLGATLPFIDTYQSRAAEPINTPPFLAVKKLGLISGFSDLSFYGLWRVKAANHGEESLETSILFGLTTPTGKTNAQTKTGQLFSLGDQPGHGAWSPFGGIVLSKNISNVSYSANVFYTQMTKGRQDTTLGSYIDYNLAAVYNLYTQHSTKEFIYSVDGVLEMNGEYMTHDIIAGIADPDSGYNSIFIFPGLRVNVSKSLSCYVTVGVPIAEVNFGTQAPSNYSAYGGIDFTF